MWSAPPARTWRMPCSSGPASPASNFAPGASRPVIRGLDNYRVRVQENGIGSHDVSALSEDHARPDRSFHRRSHRGGARAGDAALRLAGHRRRGQRHQRSHSRDHPARASASRPGAGSHPRRTAVPTAPSRSLPGPATSRCMPMLSSATPATTTRPRGASSTRFVDSDGFAFGTSYVGRNGFFGVAYSRFNSLYGIPGKDAVDEKTRIDMQQDKVQSRGEWRVRDYGIEAIRFWFGSSIYAHNEIGFDGGPARDRLALHQPGARRPRRGAASAGHDGARRAERCSRRAVRTAQPGGHELRGRLAARSGPDQQHRCLLVRGAAGHAEAAVCRSPRASSRPPSTVSACS